MIQTQYGLQALFAQEQIEAQVKYCPYTWEVLGKTSEKGISKRVFIGILVIAAPLGAVIHLYQYTERVPQICYKKKILNCLCGYWNNSQCRGSMQN